MNAFLIWTRQNNVQIVGIGCLHSHKATNGLRDIYNTITMKIDLNAVYEDRVQKLPPSRRSSLQMDKDRSVQQRLTAESHITG